MRCDKNAREQILAARLINTIAPFFFCFIKNTSKFFYFIFTTKKSVTSRKFQLSSRVFFFCQNDVAHHIYTLVASCADNEEKDFSITNKYITTRECGRASDYRARRRERRRRGLFCMRARDSLEAGQKAHNLANGQQFII